MKQEDEEEAAELAAMQNLVRPDWYTGRMWVAFVRRCLQQQQQRQLAAGIGHFYFWPFLAHFIRMGKCDIRPLESDDADALSRIAIWESQISHRESRIGNRASA